MEMPPLKRETRKESARAQCVRAVVVPVAAQGAGCFPRWALPCTAIALQQDSMNGGGGRQYLARGPNGLQRAGFSKRTMMHNICMCLCAPIHEPNPPSGESNNGNSESGRGKSKYLLCIPKHPKEVLFPCCTPHDRMNAIKKNRQVKRWV